MADDVLAALSPQAVAAFYARLADGVDARRGKLDVSLAATLMRMWLANRSRGAELPLEAPPHLRNHEQTQATLQFHRAVAPGSKTVVVYHKNAKRIEDAGLAAPFSFKTNAWQITDASLVATADIAPSRSL